MDMEIKWKCPGRWELKWVEDSQNNPASQALPNSLQKSALIIIIFF